MKKVRPAGSEGKEAAGWFVGTGAREKSVDEKHKDAV
jgi:hypothetical protein